MAKFSSEEPQLYSSGLPESLQEKEIRSLQELAQEKGVSTETGKNLIMDKIKKVGNWALNIFDKLETPFYGLSGIVAGIGWNRGIEKKIRMSEALLGDDYFSKKLQLTGTAKVVANTAEWIGRMGVDIFTDPLTWIMPATFGKFRVVADELGNLTKINKSGMEILSDLAEKKLAQKTIGLADKSPNLLANLKKEAFGEASQDVAKIVLGQKKQILATGKYGELSPNVLDVKNILEKIGISGTKENVAKAIKDGIPELQARRMFKLSNPFGSWEKDIFGYDKMSDVYNKISKSFATRLSKTETGQKILDIRNFNSQWLRGLGKKWFDIGIPEGADPLKYKQLKSLLKTNEWALLKTNERTGKIIDTLFSDFKADDLERLGQQYWKWDYFLRQGKEVESNAIWNTLAEKEKGLFNTLRGFYDNLFEQETRRGLQANYLENYLPLIFRNKQKAEELSKLFKLPDQLPIYLRFSKQRTIINPLELPEATLKELDPVCDLRNQMFARVSAHNSVVGRQNLLLSLAKDQKFAINKWGSWDVERVQVPAQVTETLYEQFVKIPIGKDAPDKVKKIINDVDNLLGKEIKTIDGVKIGTPTTLNDIENARSQLYKHRTSLMKEFKESPTLATAQSINVLKKKIGVLDDFLTDPEWKDIFIKQRTRALIPDVKDGYEVLNRVRQTNPRLSSEMLDIVSKPLVPLKDYITGVELRGEKIIPQLKTVLGEMKSGDILIEKWVADELVNHLNADFFARGGGWKEFSTPLKKFTQWFKFSVTTPFPSFHARNLISDTFRSYLESGLSVVLPRFHKEVSALATGKIDNIITDIGEVITSKQFIKELEKYNVKANAIAFVYDNKAAVIEGLKRHPFANKTIGTIARAAEWRENRWRAITYFSLRKRGFDPVSAVEKMNKAMVDYTAQTAFEREALSLALPFYKWYKSNVVQTIEKTLTETGKYFPMLKAYQGVNEMFGRKQTNPEEAKFLPLYIKEQPYIWLMSDQNKELYLYNFDLPLEQAWSMLNNPLKATFELLSPFLKVPIEAATGYNIFKEMKIKEDYSGEVFKHYPQPMKDWLEYKEITKLSATGEEYVVSTVNPQKKYLVSALSQWAGASRLLAQSNIRDIEALGAMYKAITGTEKMTKKDKLQLLHFVSGAMVYEQDPNKDRARAEKDLLNEYGNYLERVGIVKDFKQFYEDPRVTTTPEE